MSIYLSLIRKRMFIRNTEQGTVVVGFSKSNRIEMQHGIIKSEF